MASKECGWKSQSCGALALRWGCCDMIKPSCLPRSTLAQIAPVEDAPSGTAARTPAAHDAPPDRRGDR